MVPLDLSILTSPQPQACSHMKYTRRKLMLVRSDEVTIPPRIPVFWFLLHSVLLSGVTVSKILSENSKGGKYRQSDESCLCSCCNKSEGVGLDKIHYKECQGETQEGSRLHKKSIHHHPTLSSCYLLISGEALYTSLKLILRELAWDIRIHCLGWSFNWLCCCNFDWMCGRSLEWLDFICCFDGRVQYHWEVNQQFHPKITTCKTEGFPADGKIGRFYPRILAGANHI